MKIIRKMVRITHHQREIVGQFTLPEGEESCPVVICSHGFNGSYEDFQILSEHLASHGVAAFCYDFCGGSVHSKSSMATRDMTIFTEKEDLLCVMEYVRQQSRIQKENLFLFGGSQGGLVSALTAEEMHNQVRGLMLLYPALCIADDWRANFPKEEDIPDSYDLWGMEIGRGYFQAVRKFQVFEEIGSYPGKVLMMHGDQDGVVSCKYSEQLNNLYADSRLQIFPGEGHGFSKEGDETVAQMALSFVRENCIKDSDRKVGQKKIFLALLETAGLHAQKSREAFRKLDCTEGQPKIFYLLRRQDGIVQKNLAEICGIKPSTLTVLLKRMEEKGYVRRENEIVSGGKRAYRIFLTEAGWKRAEQIEAVVEELEEKSFQGMSTQERQLLLELLGKVAVNLNE